MNPDKMAGFTILHSKNVNLEGNKILGFDQAVKAKDVTNLNVSDNIGVAPEKKRKSKVWTLSNITFVIVTGIVVGVITLIFWEQIKGFFESL